MGSSKSIFFIFFSIVFLASCKPEPKYGYAIGDFKSSLQPYLTNIVSKGYVGFDTSRRFIEAHATDEELKHLSASENPMLRAVAFRAMLKRPGVDHFELLMTHLDDTAVIATVEGEWGIQYSTVSDDIIQHSKWKSLAEKNETIDKVITEHNYLKSAYTILNKLAPQDKYYKYIKRMSQRERDFEDIEYALYGLSKYKKPEDIEVIKEFLLDQSHNWRMGHTSFRLMQEYPNEAYLEVLKKYSGMNLYRKICSDRIFDEAGDFFKTVASYKEEKSADILGAILNRTPFMPCPVDIDYLRQNLLYAIWDNQCDAYSSMIGQIKPFILAYKKREIKMAFDPPEKIYNTELDRW